MVFSALHCPGLSADLLDVRLFSQTLSKLATDGLGVSALQEHFDKLQFTETAVDGNALIPNLAASVSNKFKERFLVVRRLKQAVESSWTTSPTTTPTECCQIANSPKRLEYDSRFRNKVDFANLCVKVSQSAPLSRQYVADSVLSEMKDILQQYPVIKWQYFGSEEGMLANFPAFEDTADCESYDPRYRPFYVETATPEPKDVVLVIDTSGSMSGNQIVVAKAAAKTVLSTMNPRDRVSKVK